MPQLTMLIFLNSYSDTQGSNNPEQNGIRWTRELDGVPIMDAGQTQAFSLAPGENKTLFDTTRTLAQDGTTQYSIALNLTNPNTYTLTAVGGTLPNFRAPRTTGADATTQVTVTLNGPVATFTSTGGTPFNLSGVMVGDKVRIGNAFNTLNQGEWKIISVSSTSFSVANPVAVAEGPITLGSSFATQVQIYSAAGVQINDTLVISSGFSQVSFGTYIITSVAANFLQFYTTAILPQESNIMTEIAIYERAKNLVFLEADQNCAITINGSAAGNVEPWVILNGTAPGQYLRKSTIYSMSVTNSSTNAANLVFSCVE
jgi:hypothetical protein